jgi:hypothetical protein
MLAMFAVFYSFFFWYETTEPALAGWISSYVTLVSSAIGNPFDAGTINAGKRATCQD